MSLATPNHLRRLLSASAKRHNIRRAIQLINTDVTPTTGCLNPLIYHHQPRRTVVEDKSRFADDEDEVPESERFIHKSEVERYMVQAMTKVGTEQHRAGMLAANLSEADYRGHFSHGLNRLAMYVRDCQSNLCQPNNDPVVLKKGPATAWVDGKNGLGVVAGTFCMKLAMEMAKETGIGWIAVKGSNHFGICQW